MKVFVSFGVAHPARITRTARFDWASFCALLERPVVTDDKAAAGWLIPCEFDPAYRDSENFVAAYALKLDYDHIQPADVDRILAALDGYEYVAYTTASHTPEKPRLRVFVRLSRPAGYDEFQAVSRKVASWSGIELASRESHVPAQFMFMPTQKAGGEYWHRVGAGQPLDVDTVLREQYLDWTDRMEWPRRRDADGVHAAADEKVSPLDKPGVVGDFCRAYRISEAIGRFQLPYVETATEGRWTYTNGSRPEGAVVYDDDTKCHSHHDTDPARGQTNAFDLVRLHRFGWLDADEDLAKPVTLRPSFAEMAKLAQEQPEVQAAQVERDFEVLGDDPEVVAEERKEAAVFAFRPLPDDILDRKIPPAEFAWGSYLPLNAVTALVAEGSTGKSFLTLAALLHVAAGETFMGYPTRPGTTYYVSGEDKEDEVWRRAQGVLAAMPPDAAARARANFRYVVVAGTSISLLKHDFGNVKLTKWVDRIATAVGDDARVIALDPLARLHGGQENDNTAMTALITAGEKIAALTRASVLFPHHTGKQTAREQIVDAYAGRGGSALADGARSVLRLIAAREADALAYDIDPRVVARGGILRLIHAKSSYARRADDAWLRRRENGVLEHFVPERRTANRDALLLQLFRWWSRARSRAVFKLADVEKERLVVFGDQAPKRDDIRELLKSWIAAGPLVEEGRGLVFSPGAEIYFDALLRQEEDAFLEVPGGAP